MIELHRADELVTHLASGADTAELVLQGIDLRPYTAIVLGRTWRGATFLGCTLDLDAIGHVTDTGGTWFPPFDNLPYDPYRAGLYGQAELALVDEAIYRHTVTAGRNPPVLEALAQRIHDHAIDDALTDLLAHHPRVVAIMGGHRIRRDDAVFTQVAEIARTLTRDGYLVATGGGPGAMEAANLGAWLAPEADEALDVAMATLRPAPSYTDPTYVDSAGAVRERHPDGAASLAIPTWFYGHEPTNAFATDIAKYFSNSLREDGLLAIATHGVIYTPGSAGTVQEIFMDATQNHYGTFGLVSPMVLYGRTHWTDTLPAEALLSALAGDRRYGEMMTLADDPDTATRFIVEHPPVPYEPDS